MHDSNSLQIKSFKLSNTLMMSLIRIYIYQFVSPIIMLLKSNSANEYLRKSFVPMGQHIYQGRQQTFIGMDDPFKKKLLSRYHDQSYINLQDPQFVIVTDPILVECRRFVKKLSIINPQSPILAFWNFFIQIVIFYQLSEIPIAIFFTNAVYEAQYTSVEGIALNAISVFVLFLNIFIIRPLIGFYRGGVLISSAQLTISRYARFEMIFSMFAWLFLLIYVTAGLPELVYLKLGFFLISYSLYQMDSQILIKLELKRYTLASYRLIKLIAIFLYVNLWISCVYFAIDYHYYLLKQQYYPVNLWLTNSVCSQYQNGTFIDLPSMYPQWYVWLNYAFYWTLQSITGVGYGDMTPRNPPEVVYCNFVILFMSIAYAFFINNIWQIIAQINETGDSKMYYLKMVKGYRKKYNLNPTLANRLGSYIFEIWSHGKSEQTESSINESLSQELRQQLLLIRQKKFFSKIPLLKYEINRFPDALQSLSSNLKESKYGEGQKILKQGIFQGKMCLILIGTVQIYYPYSRLTIKVEKDSLLGVADFFRNIPLSYSAVARSFCKITFLEYGKFIQQIKNRPRFYEIMRQSIEDLQIDAKHQITGEDCWVCSNPTHPTHKCVQYFKWMFQMRNFEEAAAKKYLRNKKYEASGFRHARKFFNRRKTNKVAKVIRDKPLQLADVDTVTSYKFYRPKFSI